MPMWRPPTAEAGSPAPFLPVLRSRLGIALLLLLGAVALSSCATRPSAERLAEAILASTAEDPDNALTPEEALCIADELLATGLSDTTLDGLASDFTNPRVLETEVDDVEPAVTAAALVCR